MIILFRCKKKVSGLFKKILSPNAYEICCRTYYKCKNIFYECKRMYREIFHLTEFDKYTKMYINFLKTIPNDIQMKDNKKRCGVLVCPWLNTPLPWFAVTLAILLRRICGYSVSIIVNDLWMRYNHVDPTQKNNNNVRQTKIIINVLRKYKVIAKNVEIIYLSQIEVKDIELSDKERVRIMHLAELNAIRKYLNSYNSGYLTGKEEAVSNWSRILTDFYPHIKFIISNEGWDQIIYPGGIFAESGIFTEELKRQNISMVTYDAGLHAIFLGINGFAGSYANMAETVAMINNQEMKLKAYAEADKIFSIRKNGGKDIGLALTGERIQTKLYEEHKKEEHIYDITIFLNVEHEISALGTHNLFANDAEWISKTIDYFVKNTDYTIAVREHPMQRLFGEPQLESFIKKITDSERVTVFASDADLNSYNLIEDSKVILICTSTIGIEAAMCGKRVILESECYYNKAAFVTCAKTKEEYFKYIEEMIERPVELKEEEKNEAKLYYYLTQQCGCIVTSFSPQPYNFAVWTEQPFSKLVSDDAVKTITQCIEQEIPLSYWLFKEKLG